MLIVSTDQAHSLGDVLGVPVPPTGTGEPVRVLTELETGEGGGFLDALALDTLTLLEDRWREVVDALDAQLPGSDLASPQNAVYPLMHVQWYRILVLGHRGQFAPG